MANLQAALKAIQPNKNANRPPASIAAPSLGYSTTPQYQVPSWYGQASPQGNINAPVAPSGPDPMALLAQIMGQAPPDFNNEASSELSSVYGPQYQAINQARGSAQSTKKSNEAQLNAMYGALSKDISAQSGQIQGTFDQSKAATGQAFATGQHDIANAYNSAAADNARLLQSLGIQAAASDPRLNQQQQQQSAFLQSLLATNNQGAQNALSQEQKSAQDYNTAQRGVVNAQQGEQNYQLSKSLQDRMSDLDNQNLSLHSAQAQAIQQLSAQLANQWQGQQSDLMSQMMKAQDSAQQQSNLDRGYNLDVEKFNHQLQSDQLSRQDSLDRTSYQQMGPADKGYFEAGQLFGQDTGKANQAVNLVMNTGAAGSYRDAFQFAQAVVQNAQKNNMLGQLPEDQLKSLAVYMFKQMDPQTTPSYLNGMSGY